VRYSLLLVTAGVAAAQTYSHDVRPIIAEHCINCHSPGEIAPMAFTTYSKVRPWAAAMREAVTNGTMPPWHAAPGAAHAFRNDRSLTAAQKAVIRSWAEHGAPEGEPTAPLIPPATDAKWKLGKPDITVQVPGFAIPKQGPLPYSFLIAPLHLDHDTWVRAAEFRIDQRQAIHHLNAFIRAPGSSYLEGFPANKIFVPTVAERGRKKPGEALFARRELLLGYEPGYQPMPWLEGGAKLIRAGSDLIFEMHYNPNGTEAVDHSELALYFAAEAPRYRILAIDTLRDLDLAIPPRSDSRHETLIDVPHYDFNWQTTYVLADPVKLPQGTRLVSVAGYNNTANNKFNPDPAAAVHWGDQTTDEMHIAFLELVIDRAADPNSLFQSAPKMIGGEVKK